MTSGPAAMVGGEVTGRLEPGAVADLTLIDDAGDWPVVLGVYRADDHPARTPRR